MKFFDHLMHSIRRQPSVLGGWLGERLSSIAPHAGHPALDSDQETALLDELDRWAFALYHDESDSTLWRKALERWRADSSKESVTSAMARFSDTSWLLISMEHLNATKGKDAGLGLGLLHHEFVKAGLIAGPPVVTIETRLILMNR